MSFTSDPNDFTTPAMTGYSSPSPWSIKIFAGMLDWKMFTNNITSEALGEYHNTLNSYAGQVLDCGIGNTYPVGSLKVTYGTKYLTYYPRIVQLYGSNTLDTSNWLDFRDKWGHVDYSDDWTLLVDQSSEPAWSVNETREYISLDTSSEFRYFCIKFRNWGVPGNYCSIGEVELISPAPATPFTKRYNSKIQIDGGSYTDISKRYNSKININGGTYNIIDKRYNSQIALFTPEAFSRRYNSQIALQSARPFTKRYNSQINLMGDLYITIPVYCSIGNQLFIGAEANILNVTDFTELPFSELGGSIS